MMWLKRNLPALVGSLVFLLLIGGALYLLQQANADRAIKENRYHEVQGQFENVIRKTIFPSQKNTDILMDQAKLMTEIYNDISEALPKRKLDYPTMQPWDFKTHVESELKRLRQYCEANNVKIPAGISFGFGRYTRSADPPRQEDTPALLHQMDIVERMLRLLVQSKVAEIKSIKRTYLESETDSSADEKATGGVWNKDPNLLYQSQNLEVAIRCTNEQLRNVLNNIANSTNILLLVRNIEINSERSFPADPVEGTTATGGTTTTPAASPSTPVATPPGFGQPPMPGRGVAPTGRGTQPLTGTKVGGTTAGEVPVVLGNELVSVNTRLDVIEFKPPDYKEEAAPKEPPKDKPKK